MAKYSSTKASNFWSKRLESTDPLSAVLTYNAPKALNAAYDHWEKESLKSVLPKSLKRKRALDIGSGIGRIALALAQLGAAVTAVDISGAMLKLLKKRIHKEKLAVSVNTVQSSSDNLPFGDDSFDIVTCFGLLEHLPEEVRRQTMFEAFRVMKPKGKFFVVVNNTDCVFLKESYKMKEQREDGYFVTLVGLDWLRKFCDLKQMEMRVIAANPMYALVHYYVSPNRKRFFGSERNFERFCTNAMKFQLSDSLSNPGLNRLASHFMVQIT